MKELDAQHVVNICRFGQGENACAFLYTICGGCVFTCAKGKHLGLTIQQQLASGLLATKGDNCSGRRSNVGVSKVTPLIGK